jgi:N-acetylglucosaminyldiphosphoundecaprenol N-acetyl-beta-D-mannosaminyltransferase
MSDRADVLGCAIDRLDRGATLRAIEATIDGRGYMQHMAINAAKLVAMHDDPRMREIIAGCELVNADGQSVVWASRLLGDPLPERVAGIDLMADLLGLAERRGFGIYVLGARAEVLEQALQRIRARHPGLRIAGARDGYYDAGQEAEVAGEIAASGTDIVFVAMTSPRKEIFLGTFGRALGAPFVMGVGGSVDVIAGVTRRAPAGWQRLGLEWLYRLLQEPRRMFRRYAVTNARFIGLVARALIARRGPGHHHREAAQGDPT